MASGGVIWQTPTLDSGSLDAEPQIMNRMPLLLLLIAASFLVGCQTWRPWHKKTIAEPSAIELADKDEKEVKTSMDSVTNEVSGFSQAFRGKDSGDHGTGLSSRSRDIESRLGY